mmetsp:Transcript_10732/g.20138  ORF Transcript_10732/g.20138 Transcript_10732/m.20138 type:complete len:137 (-) Transcript_10732:1112-1522(-)
MAPNRVEHLEQAIKSFVESRSGFGNRTRKLRVIHKVFSEFDRDNTGEIDEEEFLAALVRMNIVGVTETALDLFDKFDEDMSGAISYQEFATNLFPGEFEEKDDVQLKLTHVSGVMAKMLFFALKHESSNWQGKTWA